MKKRVMVVFGTRPEAIKLAPLIHALRRRADEFACQVVVTGQHREMLEPILDFFGIVPNLDLHLMRKNQGLGELTAAVVTGMDEVLAANPPHWVCVQGDTTSAMASAMAAFYRQVPVAHLEAGLRTGDKQAPFPEEVNRRLLSQMADLHCAPTRLNAETLLREGLPEEGVHITGNTVIDALLWARDKVQHTPFALPDGMEEKLADRRMILVTGHRRESFGPGFENICQALRNIADCFQDVLLVYPVHLNPNVQEPVYRILGGHSRILLLPPLPYPQFVRLMDRAYFIITDSGGVQEEAPSLGKPVLVMRDKTERIEGVDAGNAKLVGSRTSGIVRAAGWLLNDADEYRRMTSRANPYGDGRAASRVVELLIKWPG